MHIDGGCLCGAVRYRATIDPEWVSVCHCTDCQRLSGSPYRVTVILLDGAAPDIVSGTPRTFAKPPPSGSVQHFCGDCGAPLFFSNDRDKSWGLRWGSIDQRSRLSPKGQIWCDSAVGWIHDLKGLPGRSRD
jgi:hypothetical protein